MAALSAKVIARATHGALVGPHGAHAAAGLERMKLSPRNGLDH
jgi:hypothetical protein